MLTYLLRQMISDDVDGCVLCALLPLLLLLLLGPVSLPARPSASPPVSVCALFFFLAMLLQCASSCRRGSGVPAGTLAQ